jgi:hypothetical protein
VVVKIYKKDSLSVISMEEEFETYKRVGKHKGVVEALLKGVGATIEKMVAGEEKSHPIRKDLSYIVFEYMPRGDVFALISE